ncbi:MAG: FAD-dependent 5-carboxymethylaminomethyl-2-thiouridine(34) oxidoreductase MnmC, partial [Proteobacteria bacterium]|nr:FAD-dependent 5-carboxymethylaminomethyl-2-thiouridine(34) oxidoreductase MnmC [Pseudomonadota bacterium]
MAVMAAEKTSATLKFKDRPWFASAPAISRDIIRRQKTATIIGAGIAGLSAAYALVQRGWKVSIIDKYGDVAKGTSENPAAIVYPRLSADNDTDTAFYVQAYAYSLYLLKKLQEKHAEKFWFDSGMLQRFDKKRIAKIVDRFGFNDDFISVLNKRAEQPEAGPDNVYAEYGNTGVVLPPVLAEVLKKECEGMIKIIHAEVERIEHDETWRCYNAKGLIDCSDVLIIANGVSVNKLKLFQQPLQSFPVESIRGQMIELNKNRSSTIIRQAVNAEVYITPEIDGKYFVGGSYSRDDNDTAINPDDNAALLESLAISYPDVFAEQDICGAWVGFRPMSKDRVPMVGAVPDEAFFEQQYADIRQGNMKNVYRPARYHEGLYLSAAHGSRAFTSCLLSGEMIAASIEGEPAPVNKAIKDYLSPSRFIVNDLKRR